jgi:thiamine transporter
MRDERVRTVVEAGLTIALFVVVQYLGIRLPINIAGGSISLGMLPIVVLAIRRGPVIGIFTGALCGVLDYWLLEPFFVHPAQVVLDYPIAFGAVGLAGLGARFARSMAAARDSVSSGGVAAGLALVGACGRFVAHYVSGMIFFGANAPAGQPVWLYSLVYNASYMVPSAIAVAILAAIIVPALNRAVPRVVTGGV